MSHNILEDQNLFKVYSKPSIGKETKSSSIYCDPVNKFDLEEKTVDAGFLQGRANVTYLLNQILKFMPPELIQVSTDYHFQTQGGLFSDRLDHSLLYSRYSCLNFESVVEWMKANSSDFSLQDMHAFVGFFTLLIFGLESHLIFLPQVRLRDLVILDNRIKIKNPIMTEGNFIRKLVQVKFTKIRKSQNHLSRS